LKPILQKSSSNVKARRIPRDFITAIDVQSVSDHRMRSCRSTGAHGHGVPDSAGQSRDQLVQHVIRGHELSAAGDELHESRSSIRSPART
jgi:hypothetical protein